jgi:NAD(P)-dependent dehydrogenase (short-subunit alcohol dehydrogenase family)
MLLAKRVALVTGGSRGIGKAVARAFLREGAVVMLAARSEEELQIAKDELREEFKEGETATCVADVSEEENIKGLVAETVQKFSKIDILVNAAGIYGPIGPSEKVDFKKWKQTFEVNLFGTFRLIQEVVPHMFRENCGRIINFSGGGDGPFPRFSAYSASKAAVVRLTETLAAEFKEHGVYVNAIAPGGVNTVFLEQALQAGSEAVGQEQYEKFLKQKVEGGVSPEKAAELCVFLASDRSHILNGKFLSAVRDAWQTWTPKDIEVFMQTDRFNLRRVNPRP